MKTYYDSNHAVYGGQREFFQGHLLSSFEQPERAFRILKRIEETQLGPVLHPKEHGVTPILKVHDAQYLHFLETVYDRWRERFGETEAFPNTWNVLFRDAPEPRHFLGQLGYYAQDAGTPITASSFSAAKTAVNVTLTALDAILQGESAAYALVRPPGHHAGKRHYGGYCFLNNAAIAAQFALDHQRAKVAILDLDFHHGNGTQTLFYERRDIQVVSIHGHPAEAFPYFSGYENEWGDSAGEGSNLNLPLPKGTSWSAYESALDRALGWVVDSKAELLVVSLGVDTYFEDPISTFGLRSEDYLKMGRRVAEAGLPTLFVQEGGYAVDAIGINVVNVLSGFED